MISIVIPTYNRPDLLDRLLSSIKNQTFTSYEIIIINDNSKNLKSYKKVIDKYKQMFNSLTYIVNDMNMGAPYSRNIGISKSNFKLIALVDDDDEWLPSKLEKQHAIFDSNENIGICYTWTIVSENNIHKKNIYNSLLNGNSLKPLLRECFIPSPSVMVLKEAIENAGFFDIKMKSCQDWDMWTRIIKKGYSYSVVNEYLTIYHKHNLDNIGLSKNALKGYNRYYKKHFWLFIKFLKFEGLLILLKHLYSRFIILSKKF